MPGYKKRRTGKPTTYRKKKRYSAKSGIVRTVKKVIGSTKDRKLLDYNISGNISTTPGTFEISQLIVQGATDQNRAGAEIYLKSLYIDAFCASMEEYSYVRLSVVRWRKQGVAQPTIAPATNGIPSSLGSWDPDRWEIVYDKSFALHATSDGTTVYPTPKKLSVKIPIRRKCHYEQTTGSSNQQFVYLIQSNSALGVHPFIDGYMTLRWVDN